MYKLNKISKKTLEYLFQNGYESKSDISDISDSPYVLIENKTIKPCYSNSLFDSFDGKLINESKLFIIKKEIKTKPSRKESMTIKLVNSLNSSLISKINGYVVNWIYEKDKYDSDRFHIFPITEHACGNITVKHMEFIIDFSKSNDLNITFGYYDYNDEKKKYGTLTPSIKVW